MLILENQINKINALVHLNYNKCIKELDKLEKLTDIMVVGIHRFNLLEYQSNKKRTFLIDIIIDFDRSTICYYIYEIITHFKVYKKVVNEMKLKIKKF
jgi:NADH/NAD ratio-sensing transcriptional regulator Rex